MAKNKDPAFLFYSADFLVGTIDLTMEERGQYITLICLQHQKGHLSDKVIASIGSDISVDVLAKFDVDDEGKYYNTRVEAEIEKRKKYLTAQRENGSKGGRPRKANKENPNETHGLYLAKPKQNPGVNENINENINNSISKNISTNLEEGAKTPKKTKNEVLFDRFWEAYPKKKAKAEARKRWDKLKPDDDLLEKMLSAIKIQSESKEWKEDDGRYIPYPATWLNGGRWEDEPTSSEPKSAAPPKFSNFDPSEAMRRAIERSYEEG